jgi:hypothetical protein
MLATVVDFSMDWAMQRVWLLAHLHLLLSLSGLLIKDESFFPYALLKLFMLQQKDINNYLINLLILALFYYFK